MLKRVCPCASKTFKVLSYCVVKVLGTQLIEQCYTVYITYNKPYLIISEEQISHWSNYVKTYPWHIKTCLV